MKWEFSTMFTVSLMLIFIPLTGRVENLLENPWINIFPGLTFFIVGLIGGWITDNEYKKAVITVSLSYLIIGLFTVLNVSVSCGFSQCFYVTLTILGGIPIGIILTGFGMILGYQLKQKYGNQSTE